MILTYTQVMHRVMHRADRVAPPSPSLLVLVPTHFVQTKPEIAVLKYKRPYSQDCNLYIYLYSLYTLISPLHTDLYT